MAERKVKAIPQGYHALTPYLSLRNAARAIEFYKQAFGAEETLRMAGPDGKIMHAELRIGDSPLMLADEDPKMGNTAPESIGGTTGGVMVYCENVDDMFERAVRLGATALMPPADMFWGDRYGQLKDPFGHKWSIATHVRDVSPEEMKKAEAEWRKSLQQK